jgi:radical SAM superfamily enzyme YgiQ (UPF0313 family)
VFGCIGFFIEAWTGAVMNALLLYPRFPDTFWSLKHALRFIGKRAALPPLGLLTVAALLPPAWDKRLVDVNVTNLDDRDLAWADIVLISGMAVQHESACQLISRCQRAGVKVVAGGPLFTSTPDRFPQVDHLVLNEAEVTLPRFLADLEQGRAQRVYTTDRLADLQTTPPPLWRLADLRRYAMMSIQFSRGCPYDCEFCNITTLFGRRPRTKTAGQILAELDVLYNMGWRESVFFVDDNLIGNKKELKTNLLPALINWRKRRRGFAFNTQVSINLADDQQLMAMMAEAGFDTVFIGIETPDNNSLLECGKSQNENRDLVADVKRIQHAGMQVQGGFIVGFDSDSPSIFQRQIEFIQTSGIVTAMVGILQALPGTRLFDRMRKEGRLLGATTGDNVDGTTNIAPLMGLAALRDGYRRIVRQIYSPKDYYQRLRTFLREYHTPRVKTPLGPQRLLAFARSLIRLGVVGRERLQFWNLLFWTLRHRPRLFGHAVTLAITGYHFRRVCRAEMT